MTEDLLRCQISSGPEHTCRNLTVDLVRAHLGQSKIRHLGTEILIQKHIGALEVTVDNRGWDLMLMEELKGPSAVKGYSQSGPPIQRPVLIVGGVVEVVL